MSPTLTAPRRTASARTASAQTAPRRTASARTASAQTAPRRTASERTGPASRRVSTPRPARRVSGPAGGRARAQAAPKPGVALPSRALALVRGLPDHSLIDRLVRGRAWIPVLGVLLAGIVAMQVEILKLGTTMGRAMERSSVLQTENQSLQASMASLADDQRIERLAAGMGMVMPRPDSLVFLAAHPGGDVARALANVHSPDPVGFSNQLAAQAAAAAALMPPAPATVSSSAGTAATPATGSSATATPTTSTTSTTSTTTATSTSTPTTTSASTPTTSTSPATPAAPTTASNTASTAPPTTASTGTGAAALAPAGGSQQTTGG